MNTDTLYYLGAQLEGPLAGREKWAVPKRVYHFPLRWDECEKQKGIITLPQWAFDIVAGLDSKLGKDNYQLIIGVKTTPTFYSIPPHARNSPPTPEHYIDFAKFCEAVCMAFSPFGLEIWNEPEFSVSESGDDSEYFGGFGLAGDLYGAMVRVVYDYLINRPVKIISGASFGLLNPNRVFDFLKFAISAGMLSHYWSWHGYIWYYSVVDDIRRYRDLLKFSWDIQAIYDVPQILSETSLMRKTELPELIVTNPDGTKSFPHRERQKELLEFELQHRSATNIESILWYTLANNGWRHTDPIEKDVQYPVYSVWRDYQV